MVREEVPFLSLYGWSAIAFEDADLRGVDVLGDPDVLEAHLLAGNAETVEVQEDVAPTLALRERVARLRCSFARALDAAADVDPQNGRDPDAFGSGPLQGLATRISRALGRQEGKTAGEGEIVPTASAKSYLLAYHPELVPLHSADGTPCLPGGLIPLCRLHYAEQVRPEVADTVRAFFQAGVAPKVFTPEEPRRIAALFEQAGLGKDAVVSPRSISGPELAMLGQEQFTQAAIDHAVFGQVTPDQAGYVVEALRMQGGTVTVVGDGINDLAAMRQAHLSVTRQSSSPAALSMADIVLPQRSPQALRSVLEKGQRIANGLFDILKLYLVQISYLALLILAIWGTGLGFPYQSKQGSLVTIVSVIPPSLGLSLWAPAGVLPRTGLGRRLAQFVAPAAVTISVAGVLVYSFFLQRSGDDAYAQLALTYLLTISGLVLVILLRPPVRGLAPTFMGSGERSGDWRSTALALVLLVLLFVVAPVPLADELFGLKPLQRAFDYLVLGLAVLAWASVAILFWLLRPLERL